MSENKNKNKNKKQKVIPMPKIMSGDIPADAEDQGMSTKIEDNFIEESTMDPINMKELTVTLTYKGEVVTKIIPEQLSKSVITGIGTQPIIKASISALFELRQKLK